MSKIKLFIIGAIKEIKYKVTWPSYSQLQKSSLLVLIASFIFAISVGVVDFVLKNIITWLCKVF